MITFIQAADRMCHCDGCEVEWSGDDEICFVCGSAGEPGFLLRVGRLYVSSSAAVSYISHYVEETPWPI